MDKIRQREFADCQKYSRTRGAGILIQSAFSVMQSAEKFLKAYLISNSWELEKTHDLVELLEYCSGYDTEADLLFEDCSILNDYVIDGRYPADISFEEIGAKEAKEAIEKAERIKAFVLNKF